MLASATQDCPGGYTRCGTGSYAEHALCVPDKAVCPIRGMRVVPINASEVGYSSALMLPGKKSKLLLSTLPEPGRPIVDIALSLGGMCGLTPAIEYSGLGRNGKSFYTDNRARIPCNDANRAWYSDIDAMSESKLLETAFNVTVPCSTKLHPAGFRRSVRGNGGAPQRRSFTSLEAETHVRHGSKYNSGHWNSAASTRGGGILAREISVDLPAVTVEEHAGQALFDKSTGGLVQPLKGLVAPASAGSTHNSTFVQDNSTSPIKSSDVLDVVNTSPKVGPEDVELTILAEDQEDVQTLSQEESSDLLTGRLRRSTVSTDQCTVKADICFAIDMSDSVENLEQGVAVACSHAPPPRPNLGRTYAL